MRRGGVTGVFLICFIVASAVPKTLGLDAEESDHVIKPTFKRTPEVSEACGHCHLEACESPTLCVAGMKKIQNRRQRLPYETKKDRLVLLHGDRFEYG